MGHTHYWDFSAKPNKKKYNKAKELISDFVLYAKDVKDFELVGGSGSPMESVELGSIVRFNGCGKNSCESFNLGKTPSKHSEYCKTWERPYDAVVVGALILLKGEMGDDIRVSSDGFGNPGGPNQYFDLGPGIMLLIDFLSDKMEFPRGEQTEKDFIKKILDWFNKTGGEIDYNKIWPGCNLPVDKDCE